MKSYIPIFVALIALIVSLGIFINLKIISKKLNNYTPTVSQDFNEHLQTKNEDFELAVYMNYLQTHVNKLWFSGINENWELASFYIGEMEEDMAAIEKANIEEESIAVSPLIRNFGVNSLKVVAASIYEKDKEKFKESYKLLITNCNGCHKAVKHQFVKIAIPTRPVFDNQVFELQ